MKTLLITHHAKEAADIKIILTERTIPQINNDECLIKVASSGVNPSDALAVMGYFKHATLPRIPGRDFAGVVIDGPSKLVGKHVWGTGGAAGISCDGTQAEFIKLAVEEIAEVPHNMDLITAGAQPLPYVTAYYSLQKRAHIAAQESVLIVGALGQVGSAAMSICQWKKCNAIALVRGTHELAKAQQLGWNAINSEESNLSDEIIKANNGKPVDVILNSVGNIYWNDFMKSLSEFGRIITIAAKENFRNANINLFDLYRENQDIINVNTVALDFAVNAKLLNELKIGFVENKLTALKTDPSTIFSPQQTSLAYQAVLKGSDKRVVIQFN